MLALLESPSAGRKLKFAFKADDQQVCASLCLAATVFTLDESMAVK